MKRALPIVIVLVAATILLIFLGATFGRSSGTVGIASGSALPGFSEHASTPEQALSNFLQDIQRRNWDRAFASVERTSDAVNKLDLFRSGPEPTADFVHFRVSKSMRPGRCTPPTPKPRCESACSGRPRSARWKTCATSNWPIAATSGRSSGIRLPRPTFPPRSFR